MDSKLKTVGSVALLVLKVLVIIYLLYNTISTGVLYQGF